uniref:SJCHGC09791 protein n=1 Tax=Schistosoma japonicum TaxID=6182 RepID=Q5BQV8_SCHJA|nr:SJCHGC09791 protein [Schistosoma japonicum]
MYQCNRQAIGMCTLMFNLSGKTRLMVTVSGHRLLCILWCHKISTHICRETHYQHNRFHITILFLKNLIRIRGCRILNRDCFMGHLRTNYVYSMIKR